MKKLIITSLCTLGLTLLGAFGNYQNSSNGLNADKNIANAMQNIQATQQSPVNENALPVATYASTDNTVNKTAVTQLSAKKQVVSSKKAAKKAKKKGNVTVLSYGNVDLSKCKSASEVVQKLQKNGYTNINLSNINDISSLKNIIAQIKKNCPQSTAVPAPTTKPTTTPAPTSKPTTAPSATPAPTAKPTTAPSATPAPTAKPTTAPSATPAPTTKPAPTVTPAPQANSSDLTAYAKQVLQIVNQERAKAGLSALTTNTTLSAAANKRAQEIVQAFSHTRPNGSKFNTVLQEYGVTYKSAGENIAYGQRTPQEVMNGWMNSSGHRANILNTGYGKIGIGVYKVNGVIYWTQEFTN